MKKFKSLLVGLTMQMAVVGLFFSTAALAGGKTLITVEGGKPKAALAKSWKKVKDGEYEFVLDTNAELKAGTKLTPAFVKDSLESKLGSVMGVKVTPKGADKVVVSYKGAEDAFLEQVGKAKIRGGKDVELALESSVSEGSIRAKQTERPPVAGEVKVLVTKIEGQTITAVVNVSNDSKITTGSKIKIKGEIKGLKKTDTVFFMPASKEGDVWVPAPNSLKQ